MKKTQLILLALIVAAASCTKSPNSKSGTKSTTCVCTYKKNPLKDTTVKYSLNPGLSITVDSQCNYHKAVLQSYAGKNGASCFLQ